MAKATIKTLFLFLILAFCLFEFILLRRSDIILKLEVALRSFQCLSLVGLAVWFWIFLFLTFHSIDLLLVGLLLFAITAFLTKYTADSPATHLIILLAGVMFGRGAIILLKVKGKWQKDWTVQKSQITNFLFGLVIMLAFSSWWNLDMRGNFYHGPRWMGLWDNPNTYGMLMSIGALLAIGMLAQRWNAESGKQKLNAVILIAVFMMGTGLVFSYSRGAWLGAAVGLLYLAWCYGKLKWQYVIVGVGLLAAGIGLIWGHTPDSAPWYVKRADLSRPSAQHRVAAWKAGFEIMWDHPFGVGWNKAVSTYQENYSPPENGAAAITTNDYLMLGTQLGIPALVCFVAYVALQLGVGRKHLIRPADTFSPTEAEKGTTGESACEEARPATNRQDACAILDATQIACRAAVIAMLVEFWFDGGLFKLATASVFWILLELGADRGKIGHPAIQKPATCI